MARRAAAARDPMGSLFFTQVKNKALSLPGPPRFWECNKEREDTMKKKLSALLLGLALTLVLLTVTAWATEPVSQNPTIDNIDKSVKINVTCQGNINHGKTLSLTNDLLDTSAWNDSSTTVELKLRTDKVLDAYNADDPNSNFHLFVSANSITLNWDSNQDKWLINDANANFTFSVKCLKPTKPTMDSLLNPVAMNCNDSNHVRSYRFNDPGSYATHSISDVSYQNNCYFFNLTVNGATFLEYMNNQYEFSDHNITHNFADQTTSYVFKAKYDTSSKAWSLIDENGDPLAKQSVSFNVTCAKPTPPDFGTLKTLNNDNPLLAAVSSSSTPLNLTEDLLDYTNVNYRWIPYKNYYLCYIPLNETALANMYNGRNGSGLLLDFFGISLKYDGNGWSFLDSSSYVASITVVPASSVKALGLTANVGCKDSKHTLKSFTLSDNQLTFTRVWNEKEGRYEYRVSLTDDAANTLVAQYGSAIGKSHTKQSVTSVTMYWDDGDGGASMLSLENSIAVQAETEPPREGWQLTGPKIITVTAACTSGGTHTGPAKNPYQQETTVTSAKTFDGGVALYAGLTLLSLTGTALTVRRKER